MKEVAGYREDGRKGDGGVVRKGFGEKEMLESR